MNPKKLMKAIHISFIHISNFGKMNSEVYGKMVSIRAKYDSPENATGMKKEEFYKYALEQKNFALNIGVKKNHKVLETGCGYLRLGEFLIEYLKKGNYYRCDIAKNIIKFSLEKEKKKNLQNKSPNIWQIKDLKFSNLKSNYFNYGFSFSVFTHIPINEIDEIIKAMAKLLKPGGCYYASFYITDNEVTKRLFADISFHYTMDKIKKICNKYNLQTKVVPYPGNQTMIEIKKRKNSTNMHLNKKI